MDDESSFSKEEDMEDLFSFLSLIKKYLPRGRKKGDTSGYEIEVRTCETIQLIAILIYLHLTSSISIKVST